VVVVMGVGFHGVGTAPGLSVLKNSARLYRGRPGETSDAVAVPQVARAAR
jgi:hypothetical protein